MPFKNSWKTFTSSFSMYSKYFHLIEGKRDKYDRLEISNNSRREGKDENRENHFPSAWKKKLFFLESHTFELLLPNSWKIFCSRKDQILILLHGIIENILKFSLRNIIKGSFLKNCIIIWSLKKRDFDSYFG